MAIYLDPADVNNWFEGSKLTLDQINVGIETVAATTIVGRLTNAYDTSSWVDESTTPALVIQLIAMHYAAAYYRRAYSEDLVDGVGLNWAEWLERSVEGYITMILDGAIDLEGETETGYGLPSFYPDDDVDPIFSVSDTF